MAIRAAHGRSNGRCAARAPAGQLPGALLLVPLAPPAERGVLVQRDDEAPERDERDEDRRDLRAGVSARVRRGTDAPLTWPRPPKLSSPEKIQFMTFCHSDAAYVRCGSVFGASAMEAWRTYLRRTFPRR